MNQTRLIRPGLLVSLKTTIKGGVSYRTIDIDPDHKEGDSRVARWETTRYIKDAEEHIEAVKARSAARGAILKVTRDSSFGLLCPMDDESKLADAILESRRIAEAFNARAQHSRIEVFVISGRIAATDEEAARAIGSEVRELLGSMETAIRAADPEAIRAAAMKAKTLAGMLTDGAAEKVNAAIAEVRAVARDIVKRAGKAGERAADVVADVTLSRLEAARFAVLDLESSGSDYVAPREVGPAIDFAPMLPGGIMPCVTQPTPTAPSFDL